MMEIVITQGRLIMNNTRVVGGKIYGLFEYESRAFATDDDVKEIIRVCQEYLNEKEGAVTGNKDQ